MTQSDHLLRRERIMAAALRQSIDGYERVQIRTIADAAGVSASAVYHYFSSKDGLLLECLHGWLSEFAEKYAIDVIPAADGHLRLLSVIESLTEQLTSTPRLADAAARAYLHATGPAAKKTELVRHKLIQIFADAMGQGQSALRDRNQHIAELVADALIPNILAIAQKRTTAGDLRQRIEHAISAISRNGGHSAQMPSFAATQPIQSS